LNALRSYLLTHYPALGYPLYWRFWRASTASVGATQLVTLGQGWLVFELSGSPLDLGMLGAATALPNILISLLGGALADRFDKRRILLGSCLIVGSLFALLALLDATGVVRVWHVLVIAAVVAMVSGIEWPTRQSFFPHLIDRQGLLSAVALNSFLWQATRMIIPAAGGLLIGFTDTWFVFALAAAGYALMFGALLNIRITIPTERVGSTLQQVAEGFRFILGNELFLALIVLSFAAMLFGSSYMQLMPAFAKSLGEAEVGYGVLLSSTGLGSVIGTLLIGGSRRHLRPGWLVLGGALGAALLLFAFAASVAAGVFVAAACCALLSSVFASISMVTSMTVMQLEVPDRLRGRVMGIHSITYSLLPLGGLLLGAIAQHSSEVTAVVVPAATYVAIIVAVAVAQPVVRRIEAATS
jgi:MFS family permease